MSYTLRSIALAALFSFAATPAAAQFSGLGSLAPASSNGKAAPDGCPKGKKKSIGSSLLGSVFGKVARNVASDAGVSRWLPMSEVSDQLTNAIACRLDPEEQKQAAETTLIATRGGETGSDTVVGSTAGWTSSTRKDVSGSSTVVARDDNQGAGLECITVSDVIIVGGEETTANKRMCRSPGAARYALAA